CPMCRTERHNRNPERTAMAIYPTPQQIETLLAGPADRPVVMVNHLRFKQRADGTDEGVSGEEAYRRYAEAMGKFVESKGGRFLWVGRVDSQVIDTGGEGVHMIGLVEYPSRAAFVEIATDPHVQEIGVHRAAGLGSQWLIAATEEGGEEGGPRSAHDPAQSPGRLGAAIAVAPSAGQGAPHAPRHRAPDRTPVLDPGRLPARRRHHHRPGVEGAPQAVVA